MIDSRMREVIGTETTIAVALPVRIRPVPYVITGVYFFFLITGCFAGSFI